MKVAIVHDWLNQMGGAEGVLEALTEIFPGAPVFTTIYWRLGMPDAYQAWDIRATWLDRAPFIHRHHQPYLPLYPLAVQSMDLRGYDLILSNKSGFCHGVRTAQEQLHIDYCLTPTRYVWDYASYAAREGFGRVVDLLLRPFIRWLQDWDRRAADGVDHFLAISREVQSRIARFYQRDSTIIYPPVDTDRYRPSPKPVDDYFLVVSRLVPYKRIDLAVRACSELGLPLIVGGEGRDRAELEAMAGPTVRFVGRVPDHELGELMAQCRAFIFPGYEDFGIAPVEAQAAGRPVIAYAAGGALDTIVDGETGLFFHEQTPESLIDAILRMDSTGFDPLLIRRNAERFSTSRFKRELRAFVEEKWREFTGA
ncbi:MAG: glycosyltransferase [Anaerolineales bacterium]|nr:MAG: glycosyltransferase [Anaerolineales bacterium]